MPPRDSLTLPTALSFLVMAGLDPAIHVLLSV